MNNILTKNLKIEGLPYRSDFSSNESVEGERQPKNGTGADAVDMNDRTRFLSPSPLRRVDDDGQLYSRRSPKKVL